MNNIDFYISDESDWNLALHIWDDLELVLDNRKRFASKLWFGLDSFIFVNQVHWNLVKVLDNGDMWKWSLNIDENFSWDALVTRDKNIVLSILVADCVPVIFYDDVNSIVWVAHAWWRGTFWWIVKNTINEMLKIGANISEIKVIIWPSISKSSYEVWKDVWDNFRGQVKTKLIDKKQFLDLKLENKLQAIESWIKESNISIVEIDTFVDKRFFSARRDWFSKGRFGAFIWIK